eukprot:gnl/MRDRNA2_/MRDRNA2_129073_c0_seq1.p1 gnl/MRDRNA2_/MRDRNA2_129073_c0~~gnl/MRDRNA2_/MRDRNA2_129073_c0_seq1.p1  ORF type:complete len:737 (-),score=132.86 gnl/MRDRNA2_/MRDRNA2_129073_c0_seq1:39-2249(-)
MKHSRSSTCKFGSDHHSGDQHIAPQAGVDSSLDVLSDPGIPNVSSQSAPSKKVGGLAARRFMNAKPALNSLKSMATFNKDFKLSKTYSMWGLNESQRRNLMRLHSTDAVANVVKKEVSDMSLRKALRSVSDSPTLHRVVKSNAFAIGVSTIIFGNAVLIGVETDYRNEDNDWFWNLSEIVLTVIYTVELTLRGMVHGKEIMHDRWFIFDCTTVVGSLVDLLVGHLGGPDAGVNISFLRIMRLMKLARLFRLFKVLKELLLLVTSIASAMRTLVWTWILLGLVIYVFAVFYTTVLGHGHADNEIIQIEFGTVTRSCFTLFAILTMEWVETAREIWEIEPSMVMVTMFYITLTAFAIMNVVVAVIVESTMQQAMSNNDDKQKQVEAEILSHTSKMTGVFMEADVDGSGDVTKEEFGKLLRSPKIQRVLRELELDAYDLEYLFDNLDIDKNGSISLPEFVQGTLQLRGTARAKRLFELHCDMVQQANAVNTQLDRLDENQTSVMEMMSSVLKSVEQVQNASGESTRQSQDTDIRCAEFSGPPSTLNGFADRTAQSNVSYGNRLEHFGEDIPIQVSGLKTSTEFNGQIGFLQLKKDDKGNFLVKLQKSGKELLVPPGNLQPVKSGAPSEQPVASMQPIPPLQPGPPLPLTSSVASSGGTSSSDLYAVIEAQSVAIKSLAQQVASIEQGLQGQKQQDNDTQANMKAMTAILLNLEKQLLPAREEVRPCGSPSKTADAEVLS